MANCQWTAANGRFVQAIGTPSPYWAQSLPDALRAVEASGQFTDPKDLKKLHRGAELIQAGQDLDPIEACSLFSKMLELQGQPEGTPWVVLVAPTRENPQAVTGQMCSEGKFTSVMVADGSGLEGPLPKAQVTHALKSAHRRNLG